MFVACENWMNTVRLFLIVKYPTEWNQLFAVQTWSKQFQYSPLPTDVSFPFLVAVSDFHPVSCWLSLVITVVILYYHRKHKLPYCPRYIAKGLTVAKTPSERSPT
jgi:hypothetical protein